MITCRAYRTIRQPPSGAKGLSPRPMMRGAADCPPKGKPPQPSWLRAGTRWPSSLSIHPKFEPSSWPPVPTLHNTFIVPSQRHLARGCVSKSASLWAGSHLLPLERPYILAVRFQQGAGGRLLRKRPWHTIPKPQKSDTNTIRRRPQKPTKKLRPSRMRKFANHGSTLRLLGATSQNKCCAPPKCERLVRVLQC